MKHRPATEQHIQVLRQASRNGNAWVIDYTSVIRVLTMR